MGAVVSSGVKSALVLVLGVIGGGVLDDMVLSSSYVACCVVQVDRSSGCAADAPERTFRDCSLTVRRTVNL